MVNEHRCWASRPFGRSTQRNRFRKKWSVDAFRDQCSESVESAYLKLRSAYRFDLIPSVPSADFLRSSLVLESFSAGGKVLSSEVVEQNPVLSLERFVTDQIARLGSCYFKSGADDKIKLLQIILMRLSDASSAFSLPQLPSEVAIVMYQSRYSSLFLVMVVAQDGMHGRHIVEKIISIFKRSPLFKWTMH